MGVATTLVFAAACAWAATQFASGMPSAWGEKLVSPTGVEVFESKGKAPEGTQYLEFSVYREFGATFGASRLRPFQNYTPASEPPARIAPERVASRWERAELLPWLDGRRPWPDPRVGEGVWVKAAGWPWRCFSCGLSRKDAPGFGSHTWTVRGGAILSNATFPGWADWPPYFPRIVPCRPMWPELAGNVVVFTGAWAAALFVLAAWRRKRRLRLGLCVKCGYSRTGIDRGMPCPECGDVPAAAC